MLQCSKSGMVEAMQYADPVNTSGYTTAELVRINDFVVREDAAIRNDESVKALEEALGQRENVATA
jgi:hypothetical protein